MDLNQEIIFAYLEEDNPRKAFFRAFPLLTVSGVIEQPFEDDGALRIIPDRNEQFVFKDRMRNIGIWCCIDLTPFPPSANKIRTNKNYSTARGERNQYIVFSDAVHDLSEAPFFEVLTGSPQDAGKLSSQAITPRFYIQEGDVLYGPVERRNPVDPSPSGPLSASMVTHVCPDGISHTILCTQQVKPAADDQDAGDAPEAADVPAESAVAAVPADVPAPEAAPAGAESTGELPIGETLTILDQQLTPDEAIQSLVPTLPSKANLLNPPSGSEESSILREARRRPAARLNGTKLEGTRLHPVPTPVRDKVQEAVHNKARSSNNAEPLVTPVPFSTDLPEVENPVDRTIQMLRGVWRDAASRSQLIHAMTSLDGFQECLRQYYLGNGLADDSLISITRRQIDSLEMERLQTLVSLRQAREDLSAFRRKAIAEAAAREKSELTRLQAEVERLSSLCQNLMEKVNQQNRDGDEGKPEGITVRWDALLDHLKELFSSIGLHFVDEYARVLLALMSDPASRLAVVCQTPDECLQGIASCTASLGWNGAAGKDAESLNEHAAPVLHVTASLKDAERQGSRTVVVLDDVTGLDDTAYPIVAMNASAARALQSVEVEAFNAESIVEAAEEPSLQKEEARVILAPLFEAAGLTGEQLDAAAGFASTATSYLDGSIQSACDWALVLWLIPRVHTARVRDSLRDLLAPYPNASRMLG